MKIKKEYTLEQLTTESVNVITVSTATIDKERREVGRSRMAYVNSPTGRKQLSEILPDEYVTAVLALWGETPTVTDPT